jgi:hypothetical protein
VIAAFSTALESDLALQRLDSESERALEGRALELRPASALLAPSEMETLRAIAQIL